VSIKLGQAQAQIRKGKKGRIKIKKRETGCLYYSQASRTAGRAWMVGIPAS
jgi:hypothetical protein